MVVITEEQVAQREAEDTESPWVSETEGQPSRYSYDSRNSFSNDLSNKLTLALMAGLPGAGKSTLASELSRKLQWCVIEKDRYKQELVDKGWNDEKARS